MSGVHSKCNITSQWVDGKRIKKKANRPTGGKWGVGPPTMDDVYRSLNIRLLSELGGGRRKNTGGGGHSGDVRGVGARATRSMRRNTAQKVAGCEVFTLENVLRVIEKQEPAIFHVGEVSIEMVDAMKLKLRGYKNRHRTTTNGRVTIAQVLDNVNGLDRIEEGVHNDEWTSGSADGLVELLLEEDSALRRAWEVLKSVQIFEEQKTSPVMMVSGDSRKIIQRSVNHGGVDTGRELQVVPCHFDNVHNLSMCLWGVKTFLLAKPSDVAYGPAPEINLNRAVDTGGDQFTKYVVRAGEVLYLPPQWWHEVCLISRWCVCMLSLSCGLNHG
jgi:hypothetical protein